MAALKAAGQGGPSAPLRCVSALAGVALLSLLSLPFGGIESGLLQDIPQLARRRGAAMSESMLSDADVKVLDSLSSFLQRVEPLFTTVEGGVPAAQQHQVLAVSGNWYDVPHKAPALAKAAKELPDAELLLVGGRAERLTSEEAEELGGEPMVLQKTLFKRYGVPGARMVLYTGSRVTNHNLRLILHYAKQVAEFTSKKTALCFVEEAFLVRRVAASLHALLEQDESAAEVLHGGKHGVAFLPVGPRDFRGLVALHNGREDVALALLLGELSRLRRYQKAETTVTATHGTVVRGAVLNSTALAGLDSALLEQIAALEASPKVAELFAAGKHILEKLPREEMLPIATPKQEEQED